MIHVVERVGESAARKVSKLVAVVLFDGRPIRIPHGPPAVVFEPLNNAARDGKYVPSLKLTELLYGPSYDPKSGSQVGKTTFAVNRLKPVLPGNLTIATGYPEGVNGVDRSALMYGFKFKLQMTSSEEMCTPAILPVIESTDSDRGMLPDWIVDSSIPPDEEVQLWVRQFQDGDKNGPFNQIQETFAARVYRYLYYRTRNHATTEDLTQAVFLKAYSALDRYLHNGKNPFVSWLLTIAQNLAINEHRKHVEVALDDKFDAWGSDADGLLQEVMGHLSADKLRETVNQLKEDQRRVITLRFLEDLDYETIAQRLEKKEAHIRVIQFRALVNLRKMLQS